MPEAYLDAYGNLWIVYENHGHNEYIPISAANWPHSDAEFLSAMHIERFEVTNATD